MSKTFHHTVQTASEALGSELVPFLSGLQRKTLLSLLNGEEGNAIAETVLAAKKAIDEMPVTYSQAEVEDPIVHLHYFRGGFDFWVTEKDVDGGVDQAFGFVNLADPQNAELGYISITELTQNGMELDLHWTPVPLSTIKKKLGL